MNHCDRPSHKHGKDRQGYQRYKCPVCGKTYSENPNPQTGGRPPINDEPMTNAERKRRSRLKRKQQEQE